MLCFLPLSLLLCLLYSIALPPLAHSLTHPSLTYDHCVYPFFLLVYFFLPAIMKPWMALITSPVVFNTRPLPWSCRWAWLRVLGALVFLITVIQIWIYTSRHRDPNPIRTTSPPLHRPGILRPGQYVETEDWSAQDKAVDEGTQKQGEDIDERFVNLFHFFSDYN